MPHIKIILGSTRPNRFGPQAAAWVMEIASNNPDATFELVDLAEINLPFLDEPQPPSAVEEYANEHTRAWAKIVGEADGYIMVTAEYNHGVPASLKNAIDFLAKEWYYKPVAFVGYGADAGGARAIEHLRATASWLRMYDLFTHVIIPNYWSQLDQEGKFQPTEEQNQNVTRIVKDIVFWAEHMKPARDALQK